MVEDLVGLAMRLADAAGAAIRPFWRVPLAVDTKADRSPVTAADRAAERAIRDILERERPDDGIHGEELGIVGAGAERVWVIDPIDGTKAFMTGRPLFVTLIALLVRGRPVLGLIDQPITGDRWIGATGRPTLLNGRPVRTRDCASLGEAVFSATSPDMGMGPNAAFDTVRRQARLATWGGDGYAFGLLAAGTIDLIIETGLQLYDIAALAPVIEGAGGIITDWRGGAINAASDGRVVAAGDARVHRAAMAVIAAAP